MKLTKLMCELVNLGGFPPNTIIKDRREVPPFLDFHISLLSGGIMQLSRTNNLYERSCKLLYIKYQYVSTMNND